MTPRDRLAPRVAYVLVNWNTADLLDEALSALRPLAIGGEAEVVVVDNASSDGSAALVERAHPWAVRIANRANLGFARAANQGIAATRASIVCILNPDVAIEPRALRACAGVLAARPDIGALAPLLLRGDGSIWEYDDRFPTRARLLRYALLAPRDPGRLHDVGRLLGPELHETDWLAGACLFLRRDALERAGAFDESFFLYREDVDLCHRLRIHGFRIARHRGVSLAHSVAQSSRRNPGRDGGRTRIEGMRSQVLYARKRFGLPFAVALALALRLSLLPRMARALARSCLLRDAAAAAKLRWMRRAFVALDRPVPEQPASEAGGPEEEEDSCVQL